MARWFFASWPVRLAAAVGHRQLARITWSLRTTYAGQRLRASAVVTSRADLDPLDSETLAFMMGHLQSRQHRSSGLHSHGSCLPNMGMATELRRRVCAQDLAYVLGSTTSPAHRGCDFFRNAPQRAWLDGDSGARAIRGHRPTYRRDRSHWFA